MPTPLDHLFLRFLVRALDVGLLMPEQGERLGLLYLQRRGDSDLADQTPAQAMLDLLCEADDIDVIARRQGGHLCALVRSINVEPDLAVS